MTSATPPVRKVEFDILDYWRIVWKRKGVVVSTLAVLLALAAVYSFTRTPMYQATVTLLLEEPSSNKLTIQDLLSSQGGGLAVTSTYFNTELRVLQSRRLAERVVKKMNLAKRPEFQTPKGAKQSLAQMVRSVLQLRWLFPKSEPEPVPINPLFPVAVSPQDSPYVNYVLAGLTVRQIPDTRLIEANFRSAHARLAADIVNTLAQEFIDFSVETRYQATQQTSEFLNEQIARLRDDLATKEAELQKYSEEKKIFQLNEKENSIVTRYGDLQKAAFAAQMDRINAQAQYQELASLRVDAMPEIVNNQTIQSLKSSYLASKSEYEEKTQSTYKPSHPLMAELKTRVDGLKNQLEQEIKKAVDSAQSSYRTALAKEERLKSDLEAQRIEVTKTNNASILARSLQTDIDSIQTLLNSLVTKQDETQLSARLSGLKTSNIQIMDSALMPQHPYAPNTKRNLVVALLLGLFLGVGLTFVIDFLDNSIKSAEDLERITGLPSLGVIPHFSPNGAKDKGRYGSAYSERYRAAYGGKASDIAAGLAKITDVELINHLFPKISIAEDYRAVRTAILFSRADETSRVVTFTSTSPQEGKSATISNMAIAFAQLGERVLVIDADLRKPRLHKIFQVRNKTGLSDILTGRVPFSEAVQKTSVDNLWLLPSGPHPPNPAELLNSKRMRDFLHELRGKVATVLIDTPPVLAVIDPVIVSSISDMTVLVLKIGTTARKSLLRAIEELRKAKSEIIGVILNDARVRRNGYNQYAPYFQYEYYEDKSQDEEPAPKPQRK